MVILYIKANSIKAYFLAGGITRVFEGCKHTVNTELMTYDIYIPDPGTTLGRFPIQNTAIIYNDEKKEST